MQRSQLYSYDFKTRDGRKKISIEAGKLVVVRKKQEKVDDAAVTLLRRSEARAAEKAAAAPKTAAVRRSKSPSKKSHRVPERADIKSVSPIAQGAGAGIDGAAAPTGAKVKTKGKARVLKRAVLKVQKKVVEVGAGLFAQRRVSLHQLFANAGRVHFRDAHRMITEAGGSVAENGTVRHFRPAGTGKVVTAHKPHSGPDILDPATQALLRKATED